MTAASRWAKRCSAPEGAGIRKTFGMPEGMPGIRTAELRIRIRARFQAWGRERAREGRLQPPRVDMCLAVPGRVVEIMEDGDIAFRCGKVDFGGIRKEVNLAYTPEAEVGKYVLVHVGFAISVIDEEEAQRVFKYLEELGGLKEELGEIPQ
jgi:hydrogenase expression/formation protein HypC